MPPSPPHPNPAERFILPLEQRDAEIKRRMAAAQEHFRTRGLNRDSIQRVGDHYASVCGDVDSETTFERDSLAAFPAFWSLPVSERSRYVTRLKRLDGTLLSLAEIRLRAACLARDPDLYTTSLRILAAADDGRDYRDILMSLCRFWHAGLKMGIDTRSTFLAIARESTPGAAHLLTDFAQRTIEDRRLEAFAGTQAEIDALFDPTPRPPPGAGPLGG